MPIFWLTSGGPIKSRAISESRLDFWSFRTMTLDDTLELVCVTDANYAPHFAALLKSIEANKGTEHVRVHAILDGVDAALLDRIRSTVPRLEIIDYPIAAHGALNLPPILHISRATYLRLIMAEILPAKIGRVLYLDIDMIVTRSLSPLWRSDMHGRPVAAVHDPNYLADDLAKRFRLPLGGSYFNAGMLLIDLQAMRAKGYLEKALERLMGDPASYPLADQDALNEVFWQNWTQLDISWNYQRAFLNGGKLYRSNNDSPQTLPSILHFTERYKPWRSDEWHPYAWLYWLYLLQTPFFEAIRQREGVSWFRIAKFWLKYQLSLSRSRRST